MGICEHLTRKSLDLSVAMEAPNEVCVSGGQTIESYKPIHEDCNTNVQFSQQVIDEQSSNRISSTCSSSTDTDGQVEDAATLAKKRDEVTIIKWEGKQEPQVDDNSHMVKDNEKKAHVSSNTSFGISKDELLLYANDPFWVRLRWTCFVLFWLIWAALLFTALMIMVKTTKCTAPMPLAWYDGGIFIDARATLENIDENNVNIEKNMQFVASAHATGVIYELPPHLTYNVNQTAVEADIKKLISIYAQSNVQIIVDLTPNLIPTQLQSEIHSWAMEQTVSATGSDTDDLMLVMSSMDVRRALARVVRHLIELGVRGIRFRNTNSYIFKNAQNEEMRNRQLINFLHEFTSVVRNSSVGTLTFFGTSENAIGNNVALTDILQLVDKNPTQWNLNDIYLSNKQYSATSVLLFVALLPGVCIIPNSQYFTEISGDTYELVNAMHKSEAYMHGHFTIYNSPNLLAYSKHRIGSPGYFVVCNPTTTPQQIINVEDRLPVKMTVYAISVNASVVVRSKVNIYDIEIPPYAVFILTYVPIREN